MVEAKAIAMHDQPTASKCARSKAVAVLLCGAHLRAELAEARDELHEIAA